VFCLDVAVVDLDVVYTCMLQVYVSSVFRCFHTYVCKFHLDVAYVSSGFQMFSDVFASVSNACFKCFICLLLYVTCCIWMFQK
jgi:hypothetical protein